MSSTAWSANFSALPNSRYLRQRVRLSTTDWLSTPGVDSSTVTYTLPPP